MYTLKLAEGYNKKVAKFLKKQPQLKEKYQETIRRLAANPFDPLLHTKPLQGKLRKYHRLEISKDSRLLIHIRKEDIILLRIGMREDFY